MYEVKELLFGSYDEDKIDPILIDNLKIMHHSLENSFNFYGILKILSVKEKIKKRKRLLSELKSISNQSINGLLSFGKKTQNKLIEKFQNRKIEVIEEKKIEKPKVKLRAQKPKKKILNHIPSDFQPIISTLPNITSINSQDLPIGESNLNGPIDEDSLFKTSSEMKNKLDKLKNTFPNNFNGNYNQSNGIAFVINNGVKAENNQRGNNFMDVNNVNNASLICINKDKPEIIFQDEDNQEVLNPKHIYDISNVIANSNNLINEKEENNLVVLGPKIDKNKGIEYSYIKDPSIDYIDPENIGIKYNNGSVINEKRDLICLQIFQLLYEMPPSKLNEISNAAQRQNIRINPDKPQDDFYFYYTIDIGNGQKKKSNLIKAKRYKNNHFVIEFNKQYYFLLDDIKDKSIKIECYCIPCGCFDDNLNEKQRNFLVDYMKPYNLGNSNITLNTINQHQNEYPLYKNGIKLSDSSKLLIFGFNEKSNEKPTIGIK